MREVSDGGQQRARAGIPQLVALVIIFAVPLFVLFLVAETLLRLHDAR